MFVFCSKFDFFLKIHRKKTISLFDLGKFNRLNNIADLYIAVHTWIAPISELPNLSPLVYDSTPVEFDRSTAYGVNWHHSTTVEPLQV